MTVRLLQIFTCDDCRFYMYDTGKNYCTTKNRKMTDDEVREIPDWCPLAEDNDQ
jgi:ribosomal protein L33